jgi:hypothetical protein
MGVVLGRIPAPAGAPGAPLYTSPFSHPQVMYTKHPQGLRKLSAVLRTDVLSCCAPSQDSSTSSPRHSPASADRSARTSCSATRLWHRPAYVCGTPSHLAAERTPSHLAAERPGRADLGPAGCAVRAGALCPSESGRQRVTTGGPSRCCSRQRKVTRHRLHTGWLRKKSTGSPPHCRCIHGRARWPPLQSVRTGN